MNDSTKGLSRLQRDVIALLSKCGTPMTAKQLIALLDMTGQEDTNRSNLHRSIKGLVARELVKIQKDNNVSTEKAGGGKRGHGIMNLYSLGTE